MLEIDGSRGEGGGQILRSSLAMSLITGVPVHFFNIRAGRAKPGLMQQHLTCVEAAARVGNARVEGARLNSTEVTFTPGPVQGGTFAFSVGTAGSTTLVLQTVLPALLTAPQESHLTIEGGTHNPAAPPWDFLDTTFFPALRDMGVTVQGTLLRHGFFPAGGGSIQVRIQPCASLKPLRRETRGDVKSVSAVVLSSRFPRAAADREAALLRERLGFPDVSIREVERPRGPGHVLMARVDSAHTEVLTAFEEKRAPADQLVEDLVAQVRAFLEADVPVGEHLADQLMLPLAMAGGGTFVTMPLSLHARTQVELIPRFLPVRFVVEEVGRNVRVTVENHGTSEVGGA